MTRVISAPMPFVKLFGTRLFSSSLWDEDVYVRVLFLWFLGSADERGEVPFHTPSALARLANMPEEHVLSALDRLLAPDPKSRSAAQEGRRLVPLESPGQRPGWLVVNATEYREAQTVSQAKHAARQAKYRAKASKAPKRRRGARTREERAIDAYDCVTGKRDDV